MEWEHIEPETIPDNPFKIFGRQWTLITAGPLDDWNTMTAAWGGMGYLWEKDVVYTFVRPSRYTYEFMEKYPGHTLSFFPESRRSALKYCGSHSGKKVDKARETGLTPVDAGHNTVTFREANLILVCTKIYYQDIDKAHFLDSAITQHYPKGDYHRLYVSEVLDVIIK